MLYSSLSINTRKKNDDSLFDLLIRSSLVSLKDEKIKFTKFGEMLIFNISKLISSELEKEGLSGEVILEESNKKGIESLLNYKYKLQVNSENMKDARIIFSKVAISFKNILEKLNINLQVIQNGEDAGEFLLYNEKGNKRYFLCNSCGYAVDADFVLPYFFRPLIFEKLEVKKVFTPELKTINEISNFLHIEKENIIKTMLYSTKSGKKVLALVRGDRFVDKAKLRLALGERVKKEKKIYTEQILMLPLGFIGPVNMSDYLTIADFSLRTIKNGVCGANEKDYHLKNVTPGIDFDVDMIADISTSSKGDFCPLCKQGHFYEGHGDIITSLSIKESNGNYKIDITKLFLALIDQNKDEKGLVIPKNITPWDVIITVLNPDDKLLGMANILNNELSKKNIKILIDDRDISVGKKFTDSELIGIPIRVVLSPKNMKRGVYEVSVRDLTKKEENKQMSKNYHFKFEELTKNIINLLEEI